MIGASPGKRERNYKLIIHNITRITTELCLIDEDGNVAERKTGQQDISVLSEDEFMKAYAQIQEFKESWEQECQAQSE